MLVVETIAKIRRAYFVQKKAIKEICRELNISRTRRSRSALSKWIDAHAPSGRAPKAGEKTKKARGRTPGRSRVARQLRWDAP